MADSITPLIQKYTVDFASSNNFLFIKGIQGDGHSTRYVDISLLNNVQPYIINSDAVRVVIRGTKPDNKIVFNVCEILNDNTIRVEITQQMSAVSGKGNYEISVMDKVENRTLTSFPFFIMISKSSFDIGYVLSSDEFGLLVDKINQVDKLETDVTNIKIEMREVTDNCISATENCEQATENAINATNDLLVLNKEVTDAETIRVQNENNRITNESIRCSNENERIDAENERLDNENERIDAENLRIQQAIDFKNEEEIRKSNELVRINKEEQRIISEEQRIENENIRKSQESHREINTKNAISETNTATNNANAAAAYANSVGDDLVDRLNRGEFKGEKGNDGVIFTISGQFAFQIVNDDLILYYNENDDPPNFKINEDGDLIYTIE